MPRFKFFGMNEADAAIKAADAAIDPLLTSAKITTIEVNGKQLPATSDDVPTHLKILAFASTVKDGAGDKEVSQALANNTILADQAKSFETRAVTAETNSDTATREAVSLRAELQVQKDAVAKLTAENAEVVTLRKAANVEAGRVTEQINAVNTELSKRCLAEGCLSDLRDEKKELLPSTASPEARQAAAERIPVADKLATLCSFKDGKVNAAMSRLGLTVGQIPNAPAGQNVAAPKITRAQFDALSPKEQTAFFDSKGTIIS